MPKQSNSKRSKKQAAATKKLVKQSRQQAAKDLTAQWRFLRKIGAYNTKESAAQTRLTESRIRAIKKKMREVQKIKAFKNGRVITPVQFGARKTKSGKTIFDYHLNPNFAFIRTKRRPSTIEGAKATKKGVIIEKTKPTAKVRITKSGDIIETIGDQQRRRRRYKGRDLLRLIDELASGKFKFKKHDLFVFHAWGSPTESFSATADAAQKLVEYVKLKQLNLPPDKFDDFVKYTYVEIIKRID